MVSSRLITCIKKFDSSIREQILSTAFVILCFSFSTVGPKLALAGKFIWAWNCTPHCSIEFNQAQVKQRAFEPGEIGYSSSSISLRPGVEVETIIGVQR